LKRDKLDFTHKWSEGIEELWETVEEAFLFEQSEGGQAGKDLAQAS
jgi:hypothetical protein